MKDIESFQVPHLNQSSKREGAKSIPIKGGKKMNFQPNCLCRKMSLQKGNNQQPQPTLAFFASSQFISSSPSCTFSYRKEMANLKPSLWKKYHYLCSSREREREWRVAQKSNILRLLLLLLHALGKKKKIFRRPTAANSNLILSLCNSNIQKVAKKEGIVHLIINIYIDLEKKKDFKIQNIPNFLKTILPPNSAEKKMFWNHLLFQWQNP